MAAESSPHHRWHHWARCGVGFPHNDTGKCRAFSHSLPALSLLFIPPETILSVFFFRNLPHVIVLIDAVLSQTILTTVHCC